MKNLPNYRATRYLNLSATFSKKARGTVFLKFGESDYISWKTFKNVASLNYLSEDFDSLKGMVRGQPITVKVEITDGIDSAFSEVETSLYSLAEMPKISSFSVTHHTDDFVEGYNQDANLTVSSERLGKNIDVSCVIDHLAENSIPLSSIEIIATPVNGTASKTTTLKTITPTNNLTAD
jgi:hypothetical protein